MQNMQSFKVWGVEKATVSNHKNRNKNNDNGYLLSAVVDLSIIITHTESLTHKFLFMCII